VRGACSFADEDTVFLLGFANLECAPQNVLAVQEREKAVLGHALIAVRKRERAGHRLRDCGKLSPPAMSMTET
jgi:hypothetical protein